MNIQSAYTRLLVCDFKACFLFYRDLLEFDVVIDDENNGYAEFKAGDMRLSLFNRQEMAEILGNTLKPSSVQSQDTVALIFVVPDLDETCHKLRHKGVQFTTEPMTKPDYAIKTVYLRDPDGTLIGLYQTLI